MANVGLFYDHLEYFMAIWYNFWPLGIVCGQLLYFSNLECLGQEKSGNPAHYRNGKVVTNEWSGNKINAKVRRRKSANQLTDNFR
jgi:hypothetical protein